MATISFVNQKGGVGKTTSAVSVASALAAYHEQRVLLIDLDQQAQACLSFGYQKSGTVAEVRLGHLLELVEEGHDGKLPFEPALLDVGVPNLSFLPGQKTINRYFDPARNRKDLVLRLIEQIPRFDWVILDCPPTLNLVTANAIVASDWCVVPCEQSVYSLEGFSDFLGALEVLLPEQGKNPDDFYRILLTKIFASDKRSAEYMAQELRGYEDRLFTFEIEGHKRAGLIRRNDALNQAAGARQTIYTFDPSSKGAQDYLLLTQLILDYEKTRLRKLRPSSTEALPGRNGSGHSDSTPQKAPGRAASSAAAQGFDGGGDDKEGSPTSQEQSGEDLQAASERDYAPRP
jgi:chromosome partitioning protein